ncbi:two-component sensor histidine kinase [Paenibacillus sp. S3N08]|uniref:Oxygen sensor histidine kinase NreB n=1 Tax=Paenibacillus agricola TaxID=2716264 RepID=A0ABX0J4A5_9BACL|nr:two-component sensor histidine kinase [Paenibacillus agricola]
MKAISVKEDRAIYFYRYCTLLFTSLVYLLGDKDPPFLLKLGIILTLFILAKVFSVIYRGMNKSSCLFKVILGMEMVCILLLLLITGGISSPFLLCIMNPIFVAGSYLQAVYCWLILLGTIVIVTSFSYIIAATNTESLRTIFLDNSYFYLLLLHMTFFIQVLSDGKNKLERANTRTNEMLWHIKSLYQIVEVAAQSESGNLRKIFTEFALKLTEQKMAFFWDINGNEDVERLIVQGARNSGAEASLCFAMESRLKEFRSQDSPSLINLYIHGEFLIMPVKSTTRFWGVLGIRIEAFSQEEGRYWFEQELYFLSELCAIILERHQLERIENQLIIIEEQNRIAAEMHDSVSQHMFGIVYAIHSLIRQWPSIPEKQMKEQLQLILESSNTASQELRSSIYSLSSRKNGSSFWVTTVTSHLDSLSKLHALEISVDVTGDDHRLPVNHQKALFRIISEATGNAIRHGCSSFIEVKLILKTGEAKLVVQDNGNGFDMNELLTDPRLTGLGVSNMKFLVQSLGGTIEISSIQGEGTQILVVIPIDYNEKKN